MGDTAARNLVAEQAGLSPGALQTGETFVPLLHIMKAVAIGDPERSTEEALGMDYIAD